jgi:phage gp36-like protein
MSEDDIREALDDEDPDREIREGLVYQFQVDTASTSGHFEDSEGTPVTLGLGNTAERIVTGVRFKIGAIWYTIDSITDDGEGNNEVAFSGGTLGNGTYRLTMLASEYLEDRITRAIEDAEAEVDGYLARSFSLPLSSVPDLVRKWTVDIAVWNVYSRKKATILAEERHPVWKRYSDAINALKKVEENPGSLGIVPTPGMRISDSVTIQNFDEYRDGEAIDGRNLSRGSLDGW